MDTQKPILYGIPIKINNNWLVWQDLHNFDTILLMNPEEVRQLIIQILNIMEQVLENPVLKKIFEHYK